MSHKPSHRHTLTATWSARAARIEIGLVLMSILAGGLYSPALARWGGGAGTGPGGVGETDGSDDSDLALWLDASVGLTGVSISTWPDQSGNSNDAYQSDNTMQPELVTDVVNGRPVVHFDASDVTDVTGGTGDYL